MEKVLVLMAGTDDISHNAFLSDMWPNLISERKHSTFCRLTCFNKFVLSAVR